MALSDPDADAVAHHFRIIGDARAAAWLARAGERARAAYAYATAVERMREAIALLAKPEDAAMAASLCVQISYLLRPLGSGAVPSGTARKRSNERKRRTTRCWRAWRAAVSVLL